MDDLGESLVITRILLVAVKRKWALSQRNGQTDAKLLTQNRDKKCAV